MKPQHVRRGEVKANPGRVSGLSLDYLASQSSSEKNMTRFSDLDVRRLSGSRYMRKGCRRETGKGRGSGKFHTRIGKFLAFAPIDHLPPPTYVIWGLIRHLDKVPDDRRRSVCGRSTTSSTRTGREAPQFTPPRCGRASRARTRQWQWPFGISAVGLTAAECTCRCRGCPCCGAESRGTTTAPLPVIARGRLVCLILASAALIDKGLAHHNKQAWARAGGVRGRPGQVAAPRRRSR